MVLIVVGHNKTVEKNKSMPYGMMETLISTLTSRDSVWSLGRSSRKYRNVLALTVVEMHMLARGRSSPDFSHARETPHIISSLGLLEPDILGANRCEC